MKAYFLKARDGEGYAIAPDLQTVQALEMVGFERCSEDEYRRVREAVDKKDRDENS